MKSFVRSSSELYWHGFLVDLNAKELMPQFEQFGFKAKVTAYGQDHETVHEAWNEERTIVTANEAHFIRDILAHQKRDSGTTCQDLWGLLVVPSSGIVRERLLPKIKGGVPVNGSIIPWPLVAYANLCVSLHTDGTVGVRRFRRCVHCVKDTPIEDDWYKQLPEIQARKGEAQ